jgi:uncharacterized protein (TIGR00106 family)
MAGRKPKVIADITIFPVGVGPSVGDYVREAFKSMKTIKCLKLMPNAMSTLIEADDLEGVLTAARKAHDAIAKMGAKRVYIILRIDHRLDKAENAEYKLKRIIGKKS